MNRKITSQVGSDTAASACACQRKRVLCGGLLLFAALCLVVASSYAADSDAGQPNVDNSLELFSTPSSEILADAGVSVPDTVIRHRPVTVSLGLLDDTADEVLDALLFNLFDDVTVVGFVEGVINRGPRDYSIIGTVDGQEGSSFILTVYQDVVHGHVRTGDGSGYSVTYLPPGIHVVVEADESLFRPCGVGPEDVVRTFDIQAEPPIGAEDDDGCTFDVMVVYTPAARTAKGGETAIKGLINNAIDETNTAYGNSLINPRVNLVHTAEVSYTEASSGAFSTALSDLVGKSDGKMDNVHSLRDTHSADMVSLIIDDPANEYCGLAKMMYTLSHAFEDKAFSVVEWDCATGAGTLGSYSFPHELGHNMGCHHAVGDGSCAQGAGLYNYSHGWRFNGSDSVQYRTVMAYWPGKRIDYFSNPDVKYLGTATGVALGTSNEAHNALTINNVACVVANWRESSAANALYCGGEQIGTKVEQTFTIHQDKYTEGATDLHFKVWQKEDNIDIRGWKILVSHFTSATGARGDQPEPYHSELMNLPSVPETTNPDNGKHAIDVTVDGATVPYCTNVKIDVTLWLTSWNTIRIADQKWTKDSGDKKAAPDFGWTIGYPAEVSVRHEYYSHTLTIANDDSSQFSVMDLKVLASAIDYNDLNDVPFDQQVQALSDQQLEPGGSFDYDVVTDGDYVGNYVYHTFKIGQSPAAVAVIAKHPVVLPPARIPVVSHWGLITMTGLVLAAGAVVIVWRKRRLAV